MRPLALLVALSLAGCLDNAGPEDFPAQQLHVLTAPEGEQFPTDTLSPLVVEVTDEHGNPSAGRAVSWSASGSGSMTPISAVTDDSGRARARWILGAEPGTQTAMVNVVGTELSASISVETAGWRVSSVSSSRGDVMCAIDLAGDAWCWEDDDAPRRIESSVRFQSVAAGWIHVCGLSTTHRVFCWGNNDAGQLGDGTTTTRSAPTAPILPDIEFTSVTTGHRLTCALAASGTAYCWGSNQSGELGRGFASPFEPLPAPVAGEIVWRSVSPGHYATCAIDSMQRPYCWGEGDGDRLDLTAPAPVDGLAIADTVAVSGWQKCALSQGALYCWGLQTSWAAPSLLATGISTMTAAYKPFFALGTDGRAYYWGAVPNSSYGWGDPVTAFGGGLPLRAVGGTDLRPFAIERETSTLLSWTGWQFDAVPHPIDPAPIRPPTD
ncbi:MAG TPA: Ig-like domain-containing protein [Gemmatimonadales bacterium]|nr:Ig-like domain-containing protein [Gemmatimonadales bacterium]